MNSAQSHRVLSLFAVLVTASASLLFTGCATKYIKADSTSNPPPSVAFNSFDGFDLKPIAMGEPYTGQEANEKALAKIQENFTLRVDPLVNKWNASRGGGAATRVLSIEPYIQDIKFVNATARVWAGSMAGSSAVLLKIRFVDTTNGSIVAEPEFFQRAAAMGGAWSFGATDNNMLVRISQLAADYIESNYTSAVGGPTGATEELTK